MGWWMVLSSYPVLLFMYEIMLKYAKNARKFFLNHFFHKGGPLWFFWIFWCFPFSKTFKNDFFGKKIQGCLEICLRNDLFFVKLKIGTKKFQFFFSIFFFKFPIFKFRKRHLKIKNSKKKFCTASQNAFKITHAKIQTFLMMGTQKSEVHYLHFHPYEYNSARPCICMQVSICLSVSVCISVTVRHGKSVSAYTILKFFLRHHFSLKSQEGRLNQKIIARAFKQQRFPQNHKKGV